jgi:hypothetical protein
MNLLSVVDWLLPGIQGIPIYNYLPTTTFAKRIILSLR